jgi:hypothetical protein
MKISQSIAAFVLLATAGFAQDLNWAELVRRPELWPAHCTVRQAIRFDGGVTVQAGQELTVLQLNANEVQLSTADGQTTFAAEPDETDALAVARAAYAQLTPKQRVLTYPAIAGQKNLWPAEVALEKSFDLGGGVSVRAGDKVAVVEVLPDRLTVRVPQGMFQVAPYATDLMAQARRFVEDPQAGPRLAVEQQKLADAEKLAGEQRLADQKRKAQVRVLAELEGKLINSVTDKPDPLDAAAPPRYLVFFRGSSTCPITNRVAPSFIEWYRGMKPRHPDFEVIWIMTESPEDTGKFARKLGFSWRAVTYESTPSMPDVNQPITGLLPQLIVMDPSGRILINASQNAVPAAIQQLDTLLKAPPSHSQS